MWGLVGCEWSMNGAAAHPTGRDLQGQDGQVPDTMGKRKSQVHSPKEEVRWPRLLIG